MTEENVIIQMQIRKIRDEYALTAEERLSLDEEIYALEKEIAEARKDAMKEEAGQVDQLHAGIMDALEARYDAERKAEQERINESIEAWEKWSDETCAAIQAQIDALDEKAKAEDRAATTAENERKIGKLKEALTYETDEYNRKQIEKQIAAAEEAWAETQRKWDVSDQKDALKAQMEAVKEEAAAAKEALKEESEAADARYEEMTESLRLKAEAQKMLMEKSQEEILELMGEYAPEYEAAGKTLGERFYEGFAGVMGDITEWIEGFNAQFEAIQDAAMGKAMEALNAVRGEGGEQAGGSRQVMQTVNFNVPVESPNDTMRKMEEANLALAGMI